jgi:hypothetical protein
MLQAVIKADSSPGHNAESRKSQPFSSCGKSLQNAGTFRARAGCARNFRSFAGSE